MKVTINNKLYKVYWQHKNQDEELKGTICNIEEWGTHDLFCNGHAYMSPKDIFNKQKGRIVSLTKAIKHLPKDVRTLFFQQYKKEIGFK